MGTFKAFSGTVTHITDIPVGQHTESECYKTFTVESEPNQMVNFVVAPTTYFVDHAIISIGDVVSGYYDANAPVPLIYPPQFAALVISKKTPGQFVTVSQFDEQLVNSDHSLQLHVGKDTQVLLQNGQPFNGSLTNRDLIVVYGATTRSIPAQTTPSQIIVLCL